MLKRLLSTPTERLGRFTRFLVFQFKLWRHCAVLLGRNQAGTQAAALSYHTLFGIVPLAVVMFMLVQSLHSFRQAAPEMRKLLYEHTNLHRLEYPSPEDPEEKIKVVDKIDEVIANVTTRLEKEKGAITAISGIVIIWAAVGLLTTIERTFNKMYHVTRGRNWLQRIISYWSVLTLGPLLIGVGIFLSQRFEAVKLLEEKLFFDPGPMVTYFFSVLVFFFLYLLMPHAKVSAAAALWGAAIAAIVWNLARWGFGIYVVKFIPYSRFYGVMGLIPLTVLWIYITWLIVLFGLQLTFTTQHLKSLDAAEIAAAAETKQRFLITDLGVIDIMVEIARCFEKGQPPADAESISGKFNLPGEFTIRLLEHLVGRGLLVKTNEPSTGFVPATDPRKIRLSDVAEAVADADLTATARAETDPVRQIEESQRRMFGERTLGELV